MGGHVPAVELMRISDEVPERAAAAAARFGWRESCPDWRDITRSADIDLVDVVTPNDAHKEVVLDAAAQGKAIVCEKPLAPTLEHAVEMVEAVERACVPTCVCLVYRMWPAVQLARLLIARGDLGSVHSYRGYFLQDYALDPSMPFTWRFDRNRAGAGSIGDIGSHAIDLAEFLLDDEIVSVFAVTRTIISERPADETIGARPVRVEVDDEADLLIKFAAGPQGVIQTSWISTGTKTDWGFEIRGRKGAITFSWSRANELRLYLASDPAETQGFKTIVLGPQHPNAEYFWPLPGLNIGYQEAFVITLGHFLSGDGDAPTFREGQRATAVIDAALRSAESGTWKNVA